MKYPATNIDNNVVVKIPDVDRTTSDARRSYDARNVIAVLMLLEEKECIR